eukprot:scaffold670_cov136-Skeletonema_menzelii.AAC.3
MSSWWVAKSFGDGITFVGQLARQYPVSCQSHHTSHHVMARPRARRLANGAVRRAASAFVNSRYMHLRDS